MTPRLQTSLHLIPVSRAGLPEKPCEELSDSAQRACASIAALYDKVGFEPPWIGYLAEERGHLIGACAFKSPPRNGQVELAYHTFPHHEGHGHATAMAKALVDITHATDPGVTLLAHTVPVNCASSTLLKNLGFELTGEIDHADEGAVWEWVLKPQT